MEETVDNVVKTVEETSLDKILIMGSAALAGIVAKVYVEKGAKIVVAAWHARKASSPQ
jgi:hypothetical protein